MQHSSWARLLVGPGGTGKELKGKQVMIGGRKQGNICTPSSWETALRDREGLVGLSVCPLKLT